MADSATVKTSWADDVEVEEFEPPKIEDYVDENGIRITVEYTVNDEGKKVKVRGYFRSRLHGWLVSHRDAYPKITRKTKRTLQKSLVDHTVAERKQWPKFGKEKGTLLKVLFVRKIDANIVCDRQKTWSRSCYHNRW